MKWSYVLQQLQKSTRLTLQSKTGRWAVETMEIRKKKTSECSFSVWLAAELWEVKCHISAERPRMGKCLNVKVKLSKLSWLWYFCACREQCPLVRTAWFCSLCCQTQSTKSPWLLFTPRETDRQPPRRDGRVSHIDAESAWLLFLSLSFLHSALFKLSAACFIINLWSGPQSRAEVPLGNLSAVKHKHTN